jgi:hypothetical protein
VLVKPKKKGFKLGINIEQVMGWGPCCAYSLERVTEIFTDRETLTIVDVLSLPIPVNARLWVLLREELIPAPTLHEFACRCAEQALHYAGSADPRSVAAIAAKRAWLRGEIGDQDLAAARAAARDAGWAAATDAARAACWAAAGAADTAADAASTVARKAVSAAYCAADSAAASAADSAAACDAARDAQLAVLRDLLTID